jgi:GNAT superfamily N-acetyltransferase
MTLQPLSLQDLDTLRALFQSFPYKAHQQRAQGLEADRLAEFFALAEERVLRKAIQENQPCQWLLRRGAGESVFAALHEDAWHTKFYPYRFGRIAPFLSHTASEPVRLEMLDFLLDRARERGFEHLTARVDGAEYRAAQALEARGFRLVDSSVKLSVRFPDVPDLATPSRATAMRVRPWKETDIETIRRIAAQSHPMNHYYNDPWLAREDSNRLFGAWVERCCQGLACDIFVLDHRGEVEGFVVYLNPGSLNTAFGLKLVILDFVCLAEPARGGGVGRWFIAQTLQRLSDRFAMVELRTSHHNYPALACYEALGMRIISTDLIYHRHESHLAGEAKGSLS